jgi:hypothetical protein
MHKEAVTSTFRTWSSSHSEYEASFPIGQQVLCLWELPLLGSMMSRPKAPGASWPAIGRIRQINPPARARRLEQAHRWSRLAHARLVMLISAVVRHPIAQTGALSPPAAHKRLSPVLNSSMTTMPIQRFAPQLPPTIRPAGSRQLRSPVSGSRLERINHNRLNLSAVLHHHILCSPARGPFKWI